MSAITPANATREALKNLITIYPDVSNAAILKLTRCAEVLAEWNERVNLVASSTLPHIWTRHFLDSYQLLEHMPSEAEKLADIGSGAGFPGLVLSIAGFPQVHLIESIGKKADFLRALVAELELNATVHQGRAEDIKGLSADVVTARAVTNLRDLFKLSRPLGHKNSLYLYLKGKSAPEELTESRKYWTFELRDSVSKSDPSGHVLAIRNLVPVAPFHKRKGKNS